MISNHTPNSSAIRPAVTEILTLWNICTCARAHVQMHTTHDLWDMHCYMSSNHTPNFVKSVQLFLSYSLAGHFDTPHAALATGQPPPPQMCSMWFHSIFMEWVYSTVKTAWSSDVQFPRYKLFKSVTGRPAGRPLILRFVSYLRKNFASRFALRS